jgi:hypothetical protein
MKTQSKLSRRQIDNNIKINRRGSGEETICCLVLASNDK